MEILIVLIFASLCLVALAVIFFVWTVRSRTYDHSDRLSLLPLDGDGEPPVVDPSRPASIRERDASA